MQRWQGALLAAALCAGCLEPLVEDQPGYSRNVLPAGSAVGSVYDDVQLARKIDLNDGLSAQVVPMKDGFVAGGPVKYWDFGAAKRAAVPAYVLTRCGDDGRPLPNQLVEHHILIDTLPGDADYSPFRALSLACVTPKYAGELITSLNALDDAIDLGLVLEPMAAAAWRNLPVVKSGVAVSVGGATRAPLDAYYKGKIVQYQQFLDQEGEFTYGGSLPTAGYVYEITKPGVMGVAKVIFSQPFRGADGARNPAYTAQWVQVAVTLSNSMADRERLDADLASWDEDVDIVSYTGPMGAPVAKTGTVVSSITISTNRVNRPFVVSEVVP